MPEDLVRSPQVLPAGPAPELPPELFKLPGAVLAAAIAAELQPAEQAVRHLWADGVCARILHLPAGTLATARRHRRSHLCILLEGEMTVWQDGKEEEVIEGGTAWVAEPGTEYRGYVHADATWLTVFPNPDNGRAEDEILDREEEFPVYALPEGQRVPSLKELLP